MNPLEISKWEKRGKVKAEKTTPLDMTYVIVGTITIGILLAVVVTTVVHIKKRKRHTEIIS